MLDYSSCCPTWIQHLADTWVNASTNIQFYSNTFNNEEIIASLQTIRISHVSGKVSEDWDLFTSGISSRDGKTCVLQHVSSIKNNNSNSVTLAGHHNNQSNSKQGGDDDGGDGDSYRGAEVFHANHSIDTNTHDNGEIALSSSATKSSSSLQAKSIEEALREFENKSSVNVDSVGQIDLKGPDGAVKSTVTNITSITAPSQLFLFDRNDPEFDSDSDPDADLDL